MDTSTPYFPASSLSTLITHSIPGSDLVSSTSIIPFIDFNFSLIEFVTFVSSVLFDEVNSI